MIIVSQDKTKITQRLEFYIQENFSTDEELRYEIRSIGGGSFGGYKTEERAKEVLQKITVVYINSEMTKLPDIEFIDAISGEQFACYEMPKE